MNKILETLSSPMKWHVSLRVIMSLNLLFEAFYTVIEGVCFYFIRHHGPGPLFTFLKLKKTDTHKQAILPNTVTMRFTLPIIVAINTATCTL